nr:ankyrin repeat domain 60 [Rousettus aegyptiacus]
MRRAAEDKAGGGAARAAGPPGGALRADPAAGRRPPSAQPPARAHSASRVEDSQATSLTVDLTPDVFSMRVSLEETGEMFRVTNCRPDMTVLELKKELDLIAGIPLDLQRLQYLDQGILMDDTTLKFHDVVPGGIISLCVWHYDGWMELVLAAVEGDSSKLFCLGVTEDSFYQTANSQRLEEKQWRRWVSQRASVALYIASHRGHAEAVQYLLEHGANCLSRTPMGRTPLHAAAAMGRLDCINLLLRHGASISAQDAAGMTPGAVARLLNHKRSERRLFLFYWILKSGRKGTTDPRAGRTPPTARVGSGSRRTRT